MARAAAELVEAGGAYESLSELAAVALMNQLELEGGEGTGDRKAPKRSVQGPDPLGPPPRRDLGFARPVDQPLQALSPFTNRLFPIKLACRVGANLASEEDWPELPALHERAAGAARSLGINLRQDDEAHRRRGSERRWIALPVGEDPKAAARRFAAHFTIDIASDGRATGPMADLGLALVTEEDDVQLTERGWELARAPSPLLAEGDGHTLGSEEQDLFVEALNNNEAEVARISEFTGIVDGGLEQADLDESLAQKHPDWSTTAVRSHRAAMLGRLGDLGLAEVSGRGPKATVTLSDRLPEPFTGAAHG